MVAELRAKVNEEYTKVAISKATALGRAIGLLAEKIDWDKATEIKCMGDLGRLVSDHPREQTAEALAPAVAGQTIFNLFSESDAAALQLEFPGRLSTFTNGDQIHIGKKTTKVVESKKKKAANNELHPYSPSHAMMAVGLLLFTKKRKKSFFRDSLYACNVYAKEIGVSFVSFLKLRGWRAVVEGRHVKVSYVRIDECLALLGAEKAGAYHRASTMMESLFGFLKSPDLFPQAPTDFVELDYSLLQLGTETQGDNPTDFDDDGLDLSHGNEDVDLVEQDDVDLNWSSDGDDSSYSDSEYDNSLSEDDDESNGHAVIAARATKRRKTDKESEDESNKITRFYRGMSLWRNLVERQKVLQIALRTVESCFFSHVLHHNYQKDEDLIAKLFALIFIECSTRRMVLETCQDLLMFCRSEQVIRENSATLLSWITEDPANIRQKVAARSKSHSYHDYEAELNEQVRTHFKRTESAMERRLWPAKRTLVRLAVAMELKKTQKTTGAQKPMTSYRKLSTNFEKKIIERTEAGGAPKLPPEAVALLQSAPSLYDKEARVRVAKSARPRRSTKKVPAITQDDGDEEALKTNAVDEDTVLSERETKDGDEDSVLSERKADTDTAEDILSVKRDADTQETDDEDEHTLLFKFVKIATFEENRATHHRFLVRRDNDTIVLYHAPVKVYFARGLSTYKHVYENLGDNPPIAFEHGDSPVVVIGDRCSRAEVGNDFYVARPGSLHFQNHFNTKQYKGLDILARFIRRNGRPQGKRSNGYRIDVLNGGQAYEKSDNDDGYRPRQLCGDAVFDADKRVGVLARGVIGRLLDGICPMAKAIAEEMGLPVNINFQRYDEYARALANFFYSDVADVEFVTLQLLNLSLGDSGAEHTDKFNDDRPSYDRVVVKVINLADQHGHLWSLKLITGYRRNIGDFYSTRSSSRQRLCLAAETYLHSVDESYRRWAEAHVGGYQGTEVPKWYNPQALVLSPLCPWGPNDSLTLLTGIGRGYWLLAGLWCIHQMATTYQLSIDAQYQMLLVLAWQNSMARFHLLCGKMLENGSFDRSYPIFYYYEIATKEFGEKDWSAQLYGGELPRFGSVALDFKKHFGTDLSPKKGNVDYVVAELRNMVGEFNRISKPTMNNVNLTLERASKRIRDQVKCQMGYFRLMIVVQAVAHLGLGLDPRPEVHDYFVPMEKSGGYDHLLLAGVQRSEMDQVMAELAAQLSTRGKKIHTNELENILCESREGRICQKFDLFYKGQVLYRLSDEGIPLVKYYGKTEWENV